MPDPQGPPLSQLELRYQRTTKWVALWMIVAAVGIALIWQQSGYGIDLRLFFEVTGFHPSNASALTALFLFVLFVQPSRTKLAAVVAVGLVLEVLYSWRFLPGAPFTVRLNACGGGLGVAGFLALLVWSLSREEDLGRTRARIYALVAATLFLYPETGGKFLGLLSLLTPRVYDYCGYLLEGALGFYPAQEVARFLMTHPTLGLICQVVYSRLTFFVVLSLWFTLRARRSTQLDVLGASLISALVAFGFYLVLPMVGIDDFVGRPVWPMHPMPPLSGLNPAEAPGNLPRTCIPSIHTTWIMIAFLNVYSTSRKWLVLFVPVTVLTLAATLSEPIGHYTLDLFVACPYTVAVLALTMVGTPEEHRQTRTRLIVAGFLLTLLPTLAIRFAPAALAAYPKLTWTALASLAPISAWLYSRLHRILSP